MGDILVFAEQHDGTYTPGSLGLLAEAARLAASLGVQVDAVVCGSGLDEQAASALGGYGATRVVVADHEALASGLPQPAVDAIARVVADGGYTTLLLGASVLASDIAAALSARLDAGLIVDAVELDNEQGRIVTRRAGLGDSVYGHCTVPQGTAIIVARSNTYTAPDPTQALAEVARATVAVQDWSTAARVVGHEQAD